MNGLVLGIRHTSGGEALAGTLLHSLWEGAVVALVLAIVLCFARSARVRYAAACLAMIVLLSVLVVTFTHLVPERPLHFVSAGTGLTSNVTRATADALPSVSSRRQSTDDVTWMVPVWIAGVIVFYLRGLASWIAAWRLRRKGVCCAPEAWRERLDRLRARLRVTQPVALLESSLAEVPVVVGYLRPLILMPVGLLAGMPVAQVDAILLHELAHIRRYDYLVNLLQVFVEGLLFYHPAVWWISRVMRTERENCCDDVVVSVTDSAYEYAMALTALEQRRENAGMALAATGGSLMKRIQRMLGKPERRYAAVMPVLTAAILTFTMVTAVAALQLRSVEPVGAPAPTGASSPHAPAAKQPVQATAPAPIPASQPTRFIAQDSGNSGRAQFVEYFRLRRDTAFAPQLAAAASPYTKWINEDVVYIISDEERKAFKELNTDEEREKFVEQFWSRRDPTPGTQENEFKEEVYRRIGYVNEHFGAAGLAGWRTDRGRIYIQYGPPNEIEAHSSGGKYERPMAQGGGETETFPFEQWRYRWIEGVGQNVILEFVDQNENGEYKMTTDPNEKDALLHPRPMPPPAPR